MTQPYAMKLTGGLFVPMLVAAVLLATVTAPAVAQVVPPPPILVNSPIITINGSPGDQTDPHVDKDFAAYTDTVLNQIRYYRFSTATDSAIPSDPTVIDILSDVNGGRVAFSRIEVDRNAIFVFDIATASLTEIDPHPGTNRLGVALGGNTVAFVDLSTGNGDIYAYDLATNPPQLPQFVSGDPNPEGNPNVSPDGNTIVWENCPISLTNCDIFKGRRINGTWSVSAVANSPDPEGNPDTDGTWIVYDANLTGNATDQDIYYTPVVGGPVYQLALPGNQLNPSVKGGFIAFESRATSLSPADIFVYDIANNILYQVTSTQSISENLTDLSVLDNGDLRLVWAANDGADLHLDIHATTFTPMRGGDFSFGGIAPMAVAAGGSGSTAVTVNPINGFSSAVNLSVFGQPAGVTATLSPNSVVPPGGNSASSVLNVSAASFVVPANFTLTVTGATGSLSHSTTANVAVTATATSTSNSIGDMLNAGCIDNAGIGNALTSKLAAAQTAGNVQTAINTLTALKNQIQAQAGKHIHTACTIGGVTFDPVNVLLLDVQSLIDSLRVSLVPDPISGYVVDASGMGLAGAAVSVLDAGNAVVASTTTDITGFYFLATTGVLTPEGSYTIVVTSLPPGFANVTPPNQAFTWQGSAVTFANFVVN